MHLKELRINGFKSFARTTSLALEPGVTAIVGPNGCGKSNIADAIRWVLGEQKSKSLRAGSMQDVIFQGTDSRKAVNLCEVFLKFTNCEEQLGTAFHEVEVGRRVLRDGGSSYYINGKAARLKDIQRLFLDTGVGQVSYSFMLQGQIDQILSTNPAERRVIFEEAAGISRYKAQRREALNKLALVETNLARVTDVIEELSKRMGSLKRQAGKALRYKRIKRRLTHLDLALSARRFSRLRHSIGELESKETGLREAVSRYSREVGQGEASLADKRTKRTELYDILQEAQQTVFDLRSEKEQAESQAEFSAVRCQDLRKRIDEITRELSSMEDEKAAISERLAGEARTKEEQLSVVSGSDEVFRQRSSGLMAVQEKLSQAESDLQKLRQNLLVVESSVTRLRSRCTTLEVDLKSNEVSHSSLKEDAVALREAHKDLEQGLEEIVKTLEHRVSAREQEQENLRNLQEERTTITNRYREAQKEIQRLDRAVAELVAKTGVLQNLQNKLEGFSDGAKAILKGKLGNIVETDACRLLTKHLTVDGAYTKALEALLGPAVDTIVLADGNVAVSATQELERKKLGRACLSIPAPAPEPRNNRSLPPWLRPVREVVSTDESDFGGLLEALFSECYFCPDLSQFLDYWAEHEDLSFLFVGTPAGELVDRRGLVYGGHSASQPDSFLQRESEIRKLNKSREDLEKELADARTQAEELQAQLDDSEETVEEKRRLILEISQETSTLHEQERAARKSLKDNEERAERTGRELENLDRRTTEAVDRLEKARGELEAVEGQIGEGREAIETAEKNVETLRHEREKERENLAEIRLELAEKRQRLEILDRGLSELERQRKDLNIREMRRQQEVDGLTSQIGELEAAADEHTDSAAEIEKTLAVTMETLEKNRVAFKAVEAEITTLEDSLTAVREKHHESESELNRYEVQLAKQRSELEFVIEEARREYETDLETIWWKDELWQAGEALPERIRVDIEEESPDEEDEDEDRGPPTDKDLEKLETADWDEIAGEVKSLRTRLNAMGPVNIEAIEEYKEQRERYTFLKSQSDDLWNSKNALVKAIDDINNTSQELFRQTFNQIRKNFQYTFETLFGGGKGDLELVDHEDVLESGIDITARPPGTKLKTLALLSGGQKTMTAVGLLFAIYMVKPSPFCVLDELDAPLDDANIGRFVKMLERFLEYSQFLIITHSKRTIAAADTIYGVTMQEKGVSRVLSMRFDRDSGKAEEIEEAGAGI